MILQISEVSDMTNNLTHCYLSIKQGIFLHRSIVRIFYFNAGLTQGFTRRLFNLLRSLRLFTYTLVETKIKPLGDSFYRPRLTRV